MFKPAHELLSEARELQVQVILQSGIRTTTSEVRVLQLITQVLDRNLKLQPSDHIGKPVTVISDMFDEYIHGVIIMQELTLDDDGWESMQYTVFDLDNETIYSGLVFEELRFEGGA